MSPPPPASCENKTRVFSDSFSYWLFNLAVSILWFIVAIASGNWFMAIGAFVYIAFAMLVDLADTSIEEGSADEGDGGTFDFLK